MSEQPAEKDHAAHVAEVESRYPYFGEFLGRATENPEVRQAYHAAQERNAMSNKIARESRIVRVSACPRSVRFHNLRRYRWQVTTYRPTAPINPGVWDGRLHLGDEAGYTFTRWGAYRALGRAVYRPGVD